MFSAFENFMNKYLTPIANKMDKEVHLSAVKKAMVAMTPLLIIGSFCLIPEAIPNMIGENNIVSQWILNNLDTIYIPLTTHYGIWCNLVDEEDIFYKKGLQRYINYFVENEFNVKKVFKLFNV